MNAAVLDFKPQSGDSAMWTDICAASDILPNTGVCALVEGRHVAVFRVGADDYFAIDSHVLQSGSVLAEGPYDEVRRDERVITAYLGQESGEHHG